MNAKKETAEQKLLKMIEASSKTGEAEQEHKHILKKQSVLSVVRNSNRLLMLGIIIAVVLLGNEIRVGMELLGRSIEYSIEQGVIQRPLGTESLIPNIQRLSYYLAGANTRNIFQPYEAPETQNIVEVSDKNKQIARKTSHLRLVGVSWMDSVESASVMLEDVNKKETRFLKTGEKIDDITVKTIYADSVELGYENEEIIIRYDKSQM